MGKIAIVLGGGLNLETQEPNDVTKSRYDTFLKIKDSFDSVICSSGKTYREEIASRVKENEAKAGYEYLVSKGMDKNKIIQEYYSRDTFSNAYYSRLVIEKQNLGKDITVITSNFHMKKSKFLFELTFDNSYTLSFISVEDVVKNQDELERRNISEQDVLHFYKQHLFTTYAIKKGDLKSIKKFMENYNPAICGKFDEYHTKLTTEVQQKIGRGANVY